MALTITRRSVPKEEAVDALPAPQLAPMTEQEYTILSALKDLMANKIGTLMFVNTDTGQSYSVMGHNPSTGVTTLKTSGGQILHPRLSEREEKKYYPIWR